MSRTINLIIALLLALMLVGIALAADDIAEETGKEPVITEEQPIQEQTPEITYTSVQTTATRKPTPTPYPAIIEKERIAGKISTATFDAATVSVQYPAKDIGASHYVQINGQKFIPASTSTEKNTIKWKSETNPVYDLLDWNDYIIRSEYTDSRIKETIILRKEAELSFPLALTGKAAILKKENGDIAIYNREDGRWWQGIIIEKPYGIDANGKYIPMEYKIEGSTLNLVYDHAGITYPLTIDPTYKIGGILFNEFKPVKLVSPTTTYTKIPVEFTIWNATGTNTSTTLYVQNKVKIDFSDIRFASEDMTTLLKYNKTVYNLSVAKFLVEVPQVTASPGTIVNVFYGNNTATSNSTALSGISGAKYLGVNAVYSTDTEQFPFYAGNGLYNTNTTSRYSETFSTDTESRFSEWKFNNGNKWLVPTASEISVGGGMLHTGTTTSNRIITVLKSYKFRSGLFKADFVGRTTGATTRSNGLVFGWQDNQSYYMFNLTDTFAGEKNLTFYKMAAGTTTLMAQYRVHTSYLTYLNLTTLEVYADMERGVMYGYAYNSTSWAKNATPDVTAYDASFPLGKFGMRSTADTVGGLSADWDNIGIYAESEIGNTNVPATESGFYFRDDATVNALGRYRYRGWTHSSGNYVDTTPSHPVIFTPFMASGDITNEIYFTVTDRTNTQYTTDLIICSDNTESTSTRLLSTGTHYLLFVGGSSNTLYLGKTISGVTTAIQSGSYTIVQGTEYKMKLVKSGDVISGYIAEASGSYPGTPQVSGTDSTLQSGYTGFGSGYSGSSAGSYSVSISSIAISGTRYYMAPMLRGAGIGQYYDGSSTVNATRWSDDFNSDTSSEWETIAGTPAWDTNNGKVTITAPAATYSKISPKSLLFADGQYVFKYTPSATSTEYHIYVGGDSAYRITQSSANLYLYKWTGSWTSLGSYSYTMVSNSPIQIDFSWTPTGKYVFINGVLAISSSDTTFTAPGRVYIGGYQAAATSTANYNFVGINALESTSTNGIATTLGGVSHGARYDTNEYAGITFPNTASGYYQSYLPTKITNTSFTNLGLNQYFVSAINQAGTSISNISAAPRKLNVGHGQLNFDNESISINPTTTQANVFTNWSKWSGVEYDWRPTTVFTYPIVAPSIYAFSMPVGAGLANFTTNRNLGVIGTPTANVTFTDASIADPAYPVNAWLWNFNDGGAGNTSTLQNPQYKFVTPGLHTVSLTITTTSGTTDSFTKGIMMEKVNFTASPINGSAQLPVTFTTSTTNLTNIKSSWYYFGDGAANKTAALNTTHTYLWDGIYKVWHNVTYTNNQVGNSTHNVTVWGVPLITKSASYGYRPKTINFFDKSTASEKGTTAGKSWYWNFGDGNTSTLQNPTKTYSFNGTFPVTLNVHYSSGHWANTSTSVTIYSLLASYTTNRTAGYRPLNVAFNDTSYQNPLDPITSWAWIFGDGNSTTKTSPLNKNESHKYVFSGTRLTSLTTTTGGGTNSVFAKYLTVYPAGYVDHDIMMSANYTLGLDIRDASTHALITGTVTVETTGTIATVRTTNTGHVTISSPFGLITASASAPGYYSGTDAWLIDRNRNETIYLTAAKSTGTTVYYTPHQVRYRILNGYGNPLPKSDVSAYYVSTSLPSDSVTWLVSAYGVDENIASAMLNSSIAMSGKTGDDGYITFTQHGSLEYNIVVSNATEGVINWSKNVWPLDSEYNLYIMKNPFEETITNSSLAALRNATLWISFPNVSYVRLGLNYTDPTGRTTDLKFYVWDTANHSVYYTKNFGAPGTSLVQGWKDLPNIRGNQYRWNYTAVRV